MGRTNLFLGTMNASKSAQLLMQAYNLERQGKTFLIFKPKLDTRDKDVVKSRALEETRDAISISVDDNSVITSKVLEHKPNFLFVDEIQFFTSQQVKELAYISHITEIPVFAYGLLLSYDGKMFSGTKKAIECGFSIHELKMQCDFCDKKSTHHLLYIDGELITDGDQYHVGDTEYKSCCYDCYLEKTQMQ